MDMTILRIRYHGLEGLTKCTGQNYRLRCASKASDTNAFIVVSCTSADNGCDKHVTFLSKR